MKQETKSIPVSWLMEKGIPLAGGDVIRDPRGLDTELTSSTATYINVASETVEEIKAVLLSFAERKNMTGEQPVPDWVRLSVVLVDGYTNDKRNCGWYRWTLSGDEEDINTWKPDFDSLYEKYREENKSKIDEKCIGQEEHIIYTEDMWNEGVVPELGMYFYNDLLSENTKIDKMTVSSSGKLELHWNSDDNELAGILPIADLIFPTPKKQLTHQEIEDILGYEFELKEG